MYVEQSKTSLRNLTSEQKTDYSKRLMSHIAKEHDCDMQVQMSADFGTCAFSGASPNDLLKTLNRSIIQQLNRFIEDILDSNPKYYNRTSMLFESEVTADRLIVRWAV